MKQRGVNTLYSQIFVEPATVLESKRKGRSEVLNSKRNDCLIDRYFYYGRFGLRYDIILNLLSDEFFLSEVTIPKIVDENLDKLIALKKTKPTKTYFQKKWPHMVWLEKVTVNEKGSQF